MRDEAEINTVRWNNWVRFMLVSVADTARRAVQLVTEMRSDGESQAPDVWEKPITEGVAAFTHYRAQAKAEAGKVASVDMLSPIDH